MIYFQQPRCQLRIQNHIKTQQLEAHGRLGLRWLVKSLRVSQLSLYRQQTLNDHVIYSSLDLGNIMPISLQSRVEGRHRSLMPTLVVN